MQFVATRKREGERLECRGKERGEGRVSLSVCVVYVENFLPLVHSNNTMGSISVKKEIQDQNFFNNNQTWTLLRKGRGGGGTCTHTHKKTT